MPHDSNVQVAASDRHGIDVKRIATREFGAPHVLDNSGSYVYIGRVGRGNRCPGPRVPLWTPESLTDAARAYAAARGSVTPHTHGLMSGPVIRKRFKHSKVHHGLGIWEAEASERDYRSPSSDRK